MRKACLARDPRRALIASKADFLGVPKDRTPNWPLDASLHSRCTGSMSLQ
jgi:hypothetical protein